MSYPWEAPARMTAWEERAAQEAQPNWQDFEEGHAFNSDPEPAEAGRGLVKYLLELHLSGKLKANQLCTIAWWAGKAGASGDCSPLGMAPGKASGGYHRHVDRFLGHLDTKWLYEIDVPGHDRHEVARASQRIFVGNAHEMLAEEFKESPDLLSFKLKELQATNVLPPSYFENPIVQRFQHEDIPIFLLSVYLDGVSYTKRDSVLNLTVQNLVSGRRHVLMVLQRSRICRCGCAGWCSMFPVWYWLKWCLDA